MIVTFTEKLNKFASHDMARCALGLTMTVTSTLTYCLPSLSRPLLEDKSASQLGLDQSARTAAQRDTKLDAWRHHN